MMVWVVEFDHQSGTQIWVAKSRSLADAIVASVQKNIFKERDRDYDWSLANAMANWSEYSGDTEFFRINEVTLIDTTKEADKAEME